MHLVDGRPIRSTFPRPSDGQKLVTFDWTPIRYRNVISVLKNPFYAGAYAYGKSEKRTEIVEGRARKSYGHGRPLEEWEVLLKDHHEGYIDWAEFDRNQKQLAVERLWPGGRPKVRARRTRPAVRASHLRALRTAADGGLYGSMLAPAGLSLRSPQPDAGPTPVPEIRRLAD